LVEKTINSFVGTIIAHGSTGSGSQFTPLPLSGVNQFCFLTPTFFMHKSMFIHKSMVGSVEALSVTVVVF